MSYVPHITTAYAAAKQHKKRQLEFDQCDNPILDKDLEKSKKDSYKDSLSKSKQYQKHRKLIRNKKICYLSLEGVALLLCVISLAIGITKDIYQLKITGMISFAIGLLVLIWPSVFVFNNKIVFRTHKGKLCFMYMTTFKKEIYFDDKLIKKGKRVTIENLTVDKLHIQTYDSEFTYWIAFGKEKPIRKRFGQYY